MPAATITLRIPDLSKRRVAELTRVAKQLGLTVEQLARLMIEQRLDESRVALRRSFAELSESVRRAVGPVTDAELSRLVERARTTHHARTSSKRRNGTAR